MKIAILGCGWLGLELGKRLAAKNNEVRGSVTSIEKMGELRTAGIIPYNLKLYEKGIQGDIRAFLSGVQLLILDIPPGLRKNPETDFVQKIENLIPYIEKSRLPKVIFTSSTSVYKDSETFPLYTEESNTNESDNAAIQIRDVELLLLNNDKFRTSVLRFGGLIGKDRHPVKFLAGREGIKNPEAPVNLVHQEDCIKAILKIMELEKDNSIWNVVYPEHPKKAEYYKQVAEKRGLEEPKFDHSAPSKGKIISSEKIMEKCKFQFTGEI